METGCLHDLHLVMGRGMKEELRDLDLYKESGSLSGVVVRVLALLGPVMEREHKWGEQRFAKYLPERVYRRVKLMHADLNWYSMAQMVRGLLKFFIGLVKEYGDDVYKELRKWFRRWKEESDKNRLTPRRFMRQLLRIIRHLPGQDRLVTVYNGEYSPFWVFRL